MHISKKRINDIPLLFVSKEIPETASEKGTIFFYHGLTGSKEVNEKELTELAALGCLVIGVDNYGHGERRHPDFDIFFNLENPAIHANFHFAIKKTADEFPSLIESLQKDGIITNDRIGSCGISMGGEIVYRTAVVSDVLKVAVSIVGSPKWTESNPESPHNNPGKFYPKAFLSLTGGRDEIVPPHDARDFHEVLKPYYRDHPGRLGYIEYPASGHMMEEADWEDVMKKTLDWFDTYL